MSVTTSNSYAHYCSFRSNLHRKGSYIYYIIYFNHVSYDHLDLLHNIQPVYQVQTPHVPCLSFPDISIAVQPFRRITHHKCVVGLSTLKYCELE